MRCWILYQKEANPIDSEYYELQKFISEGKENDIDITVYNPVQFDLRVTREDKKSILVNGEAKELPDFILPRMGAGTTYFALAVIRHLERLGVPSYNSSESIEIAKDKLYSQQILAANNIPVPATMLVKFPVNLSIVKKDLGFPLVVKTLYGSQGNGVFLCEDENAFLNMMNLLEVTNKNANIILQEFIKTSSGVDLRVFTVGGRVVGCMKRTSADGSFKANHSSGGVVEPFEVSPEIEWLSCEASKLSNLDIAGVDLLFDENNFKVCEVNSSPGFKGMESALNVNIAKEIFHFTRVRLGIFS